MDIGAILMGVIDRIDHEVKRLNADIVEKNSMVNMVLIQRFGLFTSVSFMKEPERLKKWIMRPG